MPDRFDVLGVGVSVVDLDGAVAGIAAAVREGATGYVCVTGVHGVMEAQDDPDLRRIHNESMLTVPDGMPLVWVARRRGIAGVGRVYGPDLMRRVLENGEREVERKTEVRSPRSEVRGPRSEDGGRKDPEVRGPSDTCHGPPRLAHFLLGSTPGTLDRLGARIGADHPGARIAGVWSPPFRDLTDDEWDEAIRRVHESGASIIWVGLSTPKQERFMAEFVRRWKAEDGTPRSEVRGPKTEVRSPRSEVRGQSSEVGGPKSECWSAPTPGAGPPDLGPRPSDLALALPTSDLRSPTSVVLIGVGAAFDVLAGVRPDAPVWMKRAGLQWLHRWVQEPRRLGPRYLRIVPAFLARILPELVAGRRAR